uniref:GTPase IMAP family member 8 n=1 Tax=Erpetoichthys calabaricus TaxID=27687 RepID=A0A8C4T7H8_ERPCA
MDTAHAYGEEMLCPVCLNIFKTPVSIPCGHSFCEKCIAQFWELEDEQPYSCPVCKERFRKKPQAYKNLALNTIIKKIKKTTIKPPEKSYVQPTEVFCDFCIKVKTRAIKSCLTCLASYCKTHIKLHMESEALKAHKLNEPDTHLQRNVCAVHGKPLDLFCKYDQKIICSECSVTKHKGHNIELTRHTNPVSASLECVQKGPNSDSEIRVVLLGKSGVGKTFACNTILGRKGFRDESGTRRCEKRETMIDGCPVVVIDTPSFFSTQIPQATFVNDVRRCMELSYPGPHVFLTVVEIGNFNERDSEMIKMISDIFGRKVYEHMMVLFTHGENLGFKSIKRFVQEAKGDLKKLLSMCNYRYHVFSDSAIRYGMTIELFKKFDWLILENGARCYRDERKQVKKTKEAVENMSVPFVANESEESNLNKSNGLLEDEGVNPQRKKKGNPQERRSSFDGVIPDCKMYNSIYSFP